MTTVPVSHHALYTEEMHTRALARDKTRLKRHEGKLHVTFCSFMFHYVMLCYVKLCYVIFLVLPTRAMA
jgi:hypothetical protein